MTTSSNIPSEVFILPWLQLRISYANAANINEWKTHVSIQLFARKSEIMFAFALCTCTSFKNTNAIQFYSKKPIHDSILIIILPQKYHFWAPLSSIKYNLKYKNREHYKNLTNKKNVNIWAMWMTDIYNFDISSYQMTMWKLYENVRGHW